TAPGQRIGNALQTFDRITPSLRSVGLTTRSAAAQPLALTGSRRALLRAQLGHLAVALLERRPLLLLLGRKLQPRMQGGNAGIGQRTDVLGRQPGAAGVRCRLLRRDQTRSGKRQNCRCDTKLLQHAETSPSNAPPPIKERPGTFASDVL